MKQQAALVWISVLSFVVALVLGGTALGVGTDTSYYSDPSASEIAWKVGLNAWSNYLLVVGAIAAVGAIVVAGVRAALTGEAPKDRPADAVEPSHLAEDGL